MKTHNLVIYHCLACGAVMHAEPDKDLPSCCGRPMVKAAAETVKNGKSKVSEDAQPPAPGLAGTDRIQHKPR